MHNSNQEKQDHRTNFTMEDSFAMTIEFLRARLLSERSVSKSARQRADELARRVAELEEQLKVVSLQRKKAEKATVDVLAILENNGISDVSEAYDSSSDQETPCESKVGNNSTKEEENSVNSKLRGNVSEEFSGSDFDFSPVPQRGLSWKGRKDTLQSSAKNKDSYRRRSSFASIGSSSPKHCVGKSCRQIRRRESRSVVEEHRTDPIKLDSQENGVATSLEVSPNHSDDRPEILRGDSETREAKFLMEGSHSGSLHDEKKVTNSDVDINGHGGDKDMEKALEHQAQLIGRYEEMEKAQREWEERFRDNNTSTPDSCDPGNQSDVTEEREEIKVHAQFPARTVSTQVQEAKSDVNDVCFSNELSRTTSDGFLTPSHNDTQYLGDQLCSNGPASESLTQNFALPMTKGKQNQESLENNYYLTSHGFHHHSHSPYSLGNQPAHVSSNTGSSSCRDEVYGSQNELYALVPHETIHGFNGVLEALEQAKLSLEKKISRLPLLENGSVGKAIKSSISATKVGDRVEIPVGCAGLFRLPTDFSAEKTKSNLMVSSCGPSLGNYHPNSGLGFTDGDQIVTNSCMGARSIFSADNLLSAGDQFPTRPYMDMRSSYSTGDRLLTRQYTGTGLRISSTQKLSFDGNLDVGLPSSRQYTYPTFSSYPGVMPPTSTKEGYSTFHPMLGGMTPANNFSFYNDHTRPDLYR